MLKKEVWKKARKAKEKALREEMERAVGDLEKGWTVSICTGSCGYDLSDDLTIMIQEMMQDYLKITKIFGRG